MLLGHQAASIARQPVSLASSGQIAGMPESAVNKKGMKHVLKHMLLGHQAASIARQPVSLASSGQIAGMLELAANKRA
jgi:hypothetical protein